MPDKVVIEHNDNVMIVEHATIAGEFPDGAMLFRLFSPAGLWMMLVAPEALQQIVDMAQTVMAHAASEKLRKSVEDHRATGPSFIPNSNGFPGLGATVSPLKSLKGR